jgi:RHS repeat-associated protein
VDPLDNTVSYRYDDRLNQVAITDARANAGQPGGGVTTMTYDAPGNRLSETNALGQTKSWTYDTQNHVLTATDARQKTTVYAYYPNGDLWKETDAKGGVTEYTYTPERQVATVKDPRLNTTTNTYDLVTKRLVRTTTAMGNATVFEYDAFGRLSGQVDPRGQVSGANPLLFKSTFTYNDSDQQTSVRDPRGNTTTTSYDLAGREESVTDAKGKITTYGYDAANRRTSVTDPNLAVTQTEYDQAGNVTATVTPTGDRTTSTFDLAGRQLTMTTPRGNVAGATQADYTSTYAYDANGNRKSVTDPLANTTSTDYDALNRPTIVTDPGGRQTTTAYDENGNVLSVTNPMGHISSSTYDELNRRVTQTTPRGKVGSTTYDEVGNVKSETTPLGNQTTWTYDNDNRMASMVEPRGNVTGGTPATYTWTYTYDPAGNRLTEKSPLNHTTTNTYDATNNQTTKTDALAHLTTWGYDELNRLSAVTGPDAPACTTGVNCVGLKKSTVYAYDPAGNLTTRTDPNGHATGYTYDQSRRLKQVLSPTNQKWTYAYDPDGNQNQIVTARGNANATPALGAISKVYDRRGMLTNINFGDGTTPNVTFAYDTAGRLESMADGAGTETYTLDNAGRVTQITRGTESFTYVYDNDGNVTSRKYPDTTTHTATFDNDGRLATILSGGQTTSFTYDPAGNLTKTTLPTGNGNQENRVYDASGRITRVESLKGTTVTVRANQTLDAAGNPTLIALTRGTTTTNQTFAYDAADRVTRNCVDITTACTATAAKRIEYTYDPIGNRLSQNRVGVTTPGSTTYSYNNVDQLFQTVAGTTTTTYGYDADGNQTSSGSKGYVYDLANRLTRHCPATTTCTNTATGRTDYTYDGQGKRLTKATSGTVDTKLSWDPIGGLPELALERTNSNALIRRYVQGPTGPVSMTTSAGTFYYHRDPIGSIRSVTSSTGAEQWRHDYDPFGENRLTTKVLTTAPTNPIQFAGEALDSETNLYHLRARQYDVSAGRFSALDPEVPAVADPYISSYLYVADRPLTATDPTGRYAIDMPPKSLGRLGAASPVGRAVMISRTIARGLFAVGAQPIIDATNEALAGQAARETAVLEEILTRSRAMALSEAEMNKRGQPRKDGNHLHHIVALFSANPFNVASQRIMLEAPVSLVDYDNNIWLPAAQHRRLHTNFYYQNVNRRLERSKASGEAGVRGALRRIKVLLAARRLPINRVG